MSIGFDLSDVRSEVQDKDLEPKLGLFIDKLSLGGENELEAVVTEESGYFKLVIRSTFSENVKGLEFYQNQFSSFDEVVNCDFIRLISLCSQPESQKRRDTRVEFYNRDERVIVGTSPLRTRSYSKRFEENKYKIGFLLFLDRQIVDACKIVRRRAESYEEVKYVVNSEDRFAID